MSTTITIDGLAHSGDYSQAFLDGVTFMLLRFYYNEDDDEVEKRITVTGPLELNFEVVGDYGHGCCPNGTGSSSDLGDLEDDEALLDYIYEETEIDFEIGDVRRYIQNIFHPWTEVGGFERDRSFSDLYSFDDLDFSRGVEECSKWLESNAKLSSVLDRTTYTLVS